jgi:DNA-binding LacI/PurR family transcriptional regulator
VIERLRGVSRTLSSAGYQLILLDVERPEQRREVFRSLAQRGRFDGVLSVSLCPTEADARRLEEAGVPLVLLDREHDTLPCVTIDDVAGGRLAAGHLLALGHRRIAFLGDREENPFGFDSSARRRAGFAAALSEAGAPLAPELTLLLDAHGRAPARAAASGLLARPERPTAIFACSDAQAIGVLDAARAAGIRAPHDLSVIGFDDVEAAGLAELTTVAQPLGTAARSAWSCCCARCRARPWRAADCRSS